MLAAHLPWTEALALTLLAGFAGFSLLASALYLLNDIHDLYPLHLLEQRGGGARAAVRDALLRRVMGWVRRADRWITGSRFTASEAVRSSTSRRNGS